MQRFRYEQGCRVRTILFLIASSLFVTSRVEALEEETVTASELRPHLEFLASPDRAGRRGRGKVESAVYILRQFETMGLKPLFGDQFAQEIPDTDDTTDVPGILGYNIGGYVEGTDPQLRDEWIIVNAHYDHLGFQFGIVYPGADDNASGVAMLIEVAKSFVKSPPRRSIAFVAFDMEEQLLWGSRWFLAHAPMDVDSIRMCLTADMIGRSLGGLKIPTVFVLGAESSPQLRDTLQNVPVPDGLEMAQLGTDFIGTRSDYGPFRYRQIPFLFFSTGEHPDYHTPGDTLEKLDIDKAARVSTLISRVAASLANLEQPIEWKVDSAPSMDEVRTIHNVTLRVLEADDSGDYALSSVHRFFVSQVKAKTGYMLEHNEISPSERAWLIRAAQIMMFSLF